MKQIPNRKIKCKCCGKLKHATKYNWRIKDNVTTLDTRTCKECIAEDAKVITKHIRKNPPPKNGKCECCFKVRKLHCDHSHNKSKSFRGWLCSKCNVGIGFLGDSVVGIKRALKYLNKK